MVQAKPQGRRLLRRHFDPSVPHPSGLQMRSADVPTDSDAHNSSHSAAPREPRRERSRQQGGSAPEPLTVVKLGGSHAFGPELRTWIAAIGRLRGSIVIVPGGGPFADAVRLAQKQMGFSDSAAHAMAMMAMAQFGQALMSFEPAIRLAASRAAIRRALRDRLIPAWTPERMANAAGLPETWELTSDSLAAWLAGEIGATRLVLIKHGRFEGRKLEAEELAASGVVDPLFPRYLPRGGVRAYLASSGATARFEPGRWEAIFPEIVSRECEEPSA